MGVPFTKAHGSVRFSLSRYNTEEEIDNAVEIVVKCVERLRSISAFTPENDR
jgi:cysteine desulfurase